MNKTIIININGIVFHIEEDAYEVLKNYMTDVKRHFIDSADSLEITTDIENRIAEMFTEILTAESKQVIVEQDVHKVIGQMGTVEDFASADEEEPTASGSSYQYKSQSRRLFRDSDDHLIGGVAAGVANYFDLQPVWVRLAFAISFCFWGSGLFLYIILWIVIPKAVTRADRMAMKGEPLDLQGFKRNFEDELKNVQGHAANLHKEVKPLVYKTRDFAGDFFSHLRIFLSGAGRILLKFLGIIIMLSCIGATIALIGSLFAYFAYDKHGIENVFPFSMLNHEYSMPFMSGSFFCLAIPLLALILVSVRLIFNRVVIHRSAGLTMLLLWIASLCVVIYYSVQVAAEFRSEGKISQTVNIKPSSGNVYHLKLNDVRYLTSEDSASLDIKNSFAGKIIMDDENDYNNEEDDNGSPRSVTINIERSDVPQPVLVETFSARGSNYTNALLNAKNIFYRFTQTDSVLTFDRRIQHLEKHSWRDQEVMLTLKVPVGALLVIDENIDRYLDGVSITKCQNTTMLEHSHTAPFMMTDSGMVCSMPKPDSVLLQEKAERRALRRRRY